MTQKLTFLLLLLIAGFSAFAQEGDPIEPEEKDKREVILEDERDSAFILPSERGEVTQQPQNQRPSNIRFNTAFVPNSERENGQITEKDEPKKRYNFLYYLFYKFRKVDNADD